MTGADILRALLTRNFNTVLDIGSGKGEHAAIMRNAGKIVTTVDAVAPADHHGDYLDVEFDRQFDAVWCSHVLEHQRNVGQFLDKVFDDLKGDGWLAITVPPLKHDIVGGHLTLWNVGLLVYNLVMAGFDCSSAEIYRYGYDISVLVRKRRAMLPALVSGNGDIEALSDYFPKRVWQGFDGERHLL